MAKMILGNKAPCIDNLDELLEKVWIKPVSMGSSCRIEALQGVLENREMCVSTINWEEANERVTI